MNAKTQPEPFGLRHLVVIAIFLVTLVVNFLSQNPDAFGTPLFPNTVRTIAERYQGQDLYFLPSAYVFAVWGVIYLGVLAFVVYHSSAVGRANPQMKRVGWLFVVSCVANMVWLFLFLYEQFATSTIAMLILLASLISIYLTLNIGRKAPLSNRERWSAHVPFSTYLGWITVATVANFTYALYVAKWDGFGIDAATWAAIMMAVATVVTLTMIITRRDIAYTLVVAWALVGIWNRYSNVSLVATTALALTGVILVALVVRTVIGRGGGGGRKLAAA
jgi:hypothetical protein